MWPQAAPVKESSWLPGKVTVLEGPGTGWAKVTGLRGSRHRGSGAVSLGPGP